MTTKTAAEVASNLSIGFFSPILAQFNPVQIGETSRAVKIALAYGERLIKERGNLLSRKELVFLVQTYPDHHFVIDFMEAKSIFKKIRKETVIERKLIDNLEISDINKGVEILYKKENCDESFNQQTDITGATKSEASTGNFNQADLKRVSKNSSRKPPVPA